MGGINLVTPHQQLRPYLRACRGCVAFRQQHARTVRPQGRARLHRSFATASATENGVEEEDVREVQESSNAGRKVDPNAGELLSWEEIGERAGSDVLQGYQMLDHSGHTGQPRTAPTRVLPSEESTATDRPVLLYRDTNAWCPFCERVCCQPHASSGTMSCHHVHSSAISYCSVKAIKQVVSDISGCPQVWLALEEKNIPYDTVLINLQDKPEWFKNMVPTQLVPAVKINGELVYESYDIMMVCHTNS